MEHGVACKKRGLTGDREAGRPEDSDRHRSVRCAGGAGSCEREGSRRRESAVGLGQCFPNAIEGHGPCRTGCRGSEQGPVERREQVAWMVAGRASSQAATAEQQSCGEGARGTGAGLAYPSSRWRCSMVVGKPAWVMARPMASATATDLWWPPVQPKARVSL